MTYPFVMPGVCYVGVGALKNLGDELKRLGTKRALLVCDPGIVQAGVSEQVVSIMKKEGVEYEIFSQVELEPSTDNVEEAARVVRQGQYDVVVGLGGGSSLDVAKGAAVLATNGGSIRDYVGVEVIPKPGLPTVLIPTTAGTGAEVTLNAIFTFRDEQVKKGVVSRHLRAAVAIVDPELTLSCPPKVTAATGMDALTHAIESYVSIKATPQTDIYALEAIRLIGRSLRRAVALGSDIKVRTDMAWGSFMAGVSLANAGVGAVHALAYPLGGRFHVSHGVANALLLPYVLEFNLIGALEKFCNVAQALGEPVKDKSPREAAQAAVRAVVQLSQDVGIPQRLSQVGVTEKDLEVLADGAIRQTRLLSNNPRVLSKDDIYVIYRKAL
ncbi:MAG: iron-containing alcohol dehydrogenase [Bacillota bacterium]